MSREWAVASCTTPSDLAIRHCQESGIRPVTPEFNECYYTTRQAIDRILGDNTPMGTRRLLLHMQMGLVVFIGEHDKRASLRTALDLAEVHANTLTAALKEAVSIVPWRTEGRGISRINFA